MAWKQAHWLPLFITVLIWPNISLSFNNSIPSFIGNLWQVPLLGNHLNNMDNRRDRIGNLLAVATWWNFVTSQKLYFWSVSHNRSRHFKSKSNFSQDFGFVFTKADASIGIKDICLLLTESKSKKGFYWRHLAKTGPYTFTIIVNARQIPEACKNLPGF